MKLTVTNRTVPAVNFMIDSNPAADAVGIDGAATPYAG